MDNFIASPTLSCQTQWFVYDCMLANRGRLSKLVLDSMWHVSVLLLLLLHPGRYIPPHLRNKDASKNGELSLQSHGQTINTGLTCALLDVLKSPSEHGKSKHTEKKKTIGEAFNQNISVSGSAARGHLWERESRVKWAFCVCAPWLILARNKVGQVVLQKKINKK